MPVRRRSASLRAADLVGRGSLAVFAAGLLACKVAGGPFVTIPVSALPAETTTLLVKATFGGEEKTQQFRIAAPDPSTTAPLTFELPSGSSGTLAVHTEASDGTCVLASGDTSVEIAADAAYESAIQLAPQPLSGCSFLTYALTVSAVQRNNATGSVISDVPGIDCGMRCTAEFRPNATVTLQARVPVGSRIVSWSEASCNTGPDLRTCTVTMTGKKDVTVTFDSCKGVWCNESPDASSQSALRGVWASSANLVFAAGDGPTLLRYDGTTWRSEMLPASARNLRGVSSPRTAIQPVAVGEQATVLHNSLSGWSQVTTAALQTQRINAAGGYDLATLFVVGDGGFIRRYDPATKTYGLPVLDSMSSPIPSANLNALAPLPVTTGRHILVGSSGYCAIAEDDKGRYKIVDQSASCGTGTRSLNGAWFGTTSGFIVGDGGFIVRYNGALNTYSTMASGTTTPLRAVFGTSDTQVYAVGDNGTILRYDGTSWSAMTSNTTRHLYGVWGLASGEIYAVGQNGTILHYFP
jgi:hypothetical protein